MGKKYLKGFNELKALQFYLKFYNKFDFSGCLM